MIRIIQTTLLCVGFCCLGQNNENLLRDYTNPALFQQPRHNKYYLKTQVFDTEFGIHENRIGSIFCLNKNTFHLSYQQFGYKHYQERKITLGGSQKMNSSINLGINISLHGAKSPSYNLHKAFTFDIGCSYKNHKYSLDLLLQNPLNNSYIRDDIQSRIIFTTSYFWSSNLRSNIQIEESIHTGMHLKHEFNYIYDKKVSIGILQSFYPVEYGFRMGYKKRAFEIYSSYLKLPWANSLGFALIYPSK